MLSLMHPECVTNDLGNVEIEPLDDMLVDEAISIFKHIFSVSTYHDPINDRMVARVNVIDSSMIDDSVDRLLLEFNTKTLLRMYAVASLEQDTVEYELKCHNDIMWQIGEIIKSVCNVITRFLKGYEGFKRIDMYEEERTLRDRLEWLRLIQQMTLLSMETVLVRHAELKESVEEID